MRIRENRKLGDSVSERHLESQRKRQEVTHIEKRGETQTVRATERKRDNWKQKTTQGAYWNGKKDI